MRVTSDDPGEVPDAVVLVFRRSVREGAHAHHLVAGREMGPPRRSLLFPDDEFPASFCEKPMIRTGDERRTVFQGDAIGRLDDAPVSEHARLHVAAIPSLAPGAIESVAGTNLSD